ncbi:MAG: cyclic nucleotide-binding domain-containing protein [Parachlamydia sp.]|nr:cyclic nucleotide-binding domain-containing protein [Parachlamydia sp.]
MDPAQLEQLAKASQLVTFPEGHMIFREGERSEGIYIILEGSVRVLTHDRTKQPIPLARLNQGDYFGEQAFTGGSVKPRNASVETLAETTLLKMDAKWIEPFLTGDWMEAVMQKAADHSPRIRSYLIKPARGGHFDAFKPGQHIVIQVKVGEQWLERPYSISGSECDSLQITIKLDPRSLFARWMKEAPDNLQIYVSQPRGEFLFDSAPLPAICFAGGVGIAPFLSFAQFLDQNRIAKRVHLLYCALNSNDFIRKDELQQISSRLPSLTLAYKPEDREGMLTESEIVQHVKALGEPDVYICGPEAFVNLIAQSLKKANYPEEKVRFETFHHARV